MFLSKPLKSVLLMKGGEWKIMSDVKTSFFLQLPLGGDLRLFLSLRMSLGMSFGKTPVACTVVDEECFPVIPSPNEGDDTE